MMGVFVTKIEQEKIKRHFYIFADNFLNISAM